MTSRLLNVVPFLITAALSSTAPAGDSQPDQPEDLQLVGWLATVEPADRRITLLPEGSEDLEELTVAEDAQITQGERVLTLQELVIRVGRRMTGHYREFGGRRILRRIIVDPEG